MAREQIAIGVDVGGSGIKAAVVDVEGGQLCSERLRVATPEPSTPEAVIASIGRLTKRLARSAQLDLSTPVGIGLPGTTIGGSLTFVGNVDRSWVGYPVQGRLGEATGRVVSIVNDADAAGVAEMRFGMGKRRRGVVILLTLGTGVGSALFIDGKLVPNTELGQIEIRGRPAERRSAAAARIRRGLSWKAWTQDLDEHLQWIDLLTWPTLMILGGGVSKHGDRFIPKLTVRAPVVAASLRNDAGIIGAAIVAAEAARLEASAPTVFRPNPP